jgi:tRNA(fMet)-specific endonuclease VapC
VALGLAIDANRYVDFCRGMPDVVDVLRRAPRIVVPFIVLAELRAGFRCGTRSQRNERNLIRFMQSPRVEVAFADEATTHFHASLFAELRRAGTPVPTNDLWIAALVLQHDLVLFTRDRHFDQIPHVPRQ